MIHFGTTKSGHQVHQLTLSNDLFLVKLLTLGVCLQDLRLKEVDHSLTVGFDSLEPYEGDLFHVGTLMGPVANRIRGAQATIGSKLHQFDRNYMGAHTLHGGSGATHAKVWKVIDHTSSTAHFETTLPDGEGGFPGNRHIKARFDLTGATLSLTLNATTDKPTILNLANHSYWNLGPNPTTRGHILTVQADRYTPNDKILMPTGEVLPVDNTRYDYRDSRAIEAGDEGLIDLNLCLSARRKKVRPVATMTGPTGISMEMSTTEPGLQLFDGHILGVTNHKTLDGIKSQNYGAFALEAQSWPDATNNVDFPSIDMCPATPYEQVTTWTFSGLKFFRHKAHSDPGSQEISKFKGA